MGLFSVDGNADGSLHHNPHAALESPPGWSAASAVNPSDVARDQHPGRGLTDLGDRASGDLFRQPLKSRLVQGVPDLRDKLIHLT
ncbi:hypothetical protein ACWEO4_44805 [Streptomyces sp. NPDC004393]